MALFDGYVRERQPSPATIKRWRPVIVNLTHHLGHDEALRVSADDIVDWKEALMDPGVSGRTVREVYLAAAKVVFAWAVENRKLATNPATGISVRVPKRVRSRGPSFTALEVRTILSGSLVMDQGRVSPEGRRLPLSRSGHRHDHQHGTVDDLDPRGGGSVRTRHPGRTPAGGY